MDKHLLTLWQSISSGSIKQIEIADLLQLSPKQTARCLQKWTKEGWLKYISGHGRGNVSTLKWLKNVEAIFEEQVMTMIDEDPVELSSKYLVLDWSPDSKLRLMNKFKSKFGYDQSTNDKLVIPRRYPFLTIHPLKAADVNSASLVANIYNRLVAVDEKGFVSPELAHSWDVSPSKVRLYMKKDIKFHDGSILTAEDVVTCLEKLRTYPQYQLLWRPVQQIQIAAPLVIDIHFPTGCSYCLQMLGTMNASIYKETKSGLVGTGCFYMEDNDEKKTTLVAFKDFFGERPLLDMIEFVQVPEEFDVVYRSSALEENHSTFQVESDSGFGIVMMNTFRNSAIQRKEIRDYIHYIIAKKRQEIVRTDPRKLPNHKGCLIGKSQSYPIHKTRKPVFTEPLVLKLVNYTENTTLWLKNLLEEEGVPVVTKWVSFKDTVINNSANEEADLFIHGEVFEMNQNFSFFFFLLNGYSKLASILKKEKKLASYLEEYIHTPFEEWTNLNLKVEKELIDQSIIVPLYYAKRQIPFSADLMNINIKHFGYVDFSKLWVRPELE
ncbi:ABC transporter substrate-binding protein [Psychrobacillus lasiicapitis]|uniref:ABC transporter substrate-binding protein n=1 Tax=Psychrobacillus lasiicapitis TaxID=1636719 RepID=A0A544TB23_9BACI|nr:ABC transporter substrate-binding protein [Psychrobacillus lasiicapitis]TQR14568.1 ABC transporter substrate-binding protein [Psychrobacillus lasiicapitis]GGA30293.1 ABC transporter substrate-binding protein [Psychrobacillus lasiicapitis]